jgi:hypothetical protein
MAQQKQQQAASATAPAASPGFRLSPQTQSKILWGLFALWAVLVCVAIAHHEQWRDEGSDWMTVKHVGLKELVVTLIPQIGHPPLWYFLMYPLGNMGLPLITVNIVSTVVMAIALYVMLFRLKFPFFLKVALIFSMFFVFEYPVVGRNYCLVVLFLMLVLNAYPRRFETPLLYGLLVVCLFNTHLMVFPMAFGILLLYIWEMVEFKKINGKTIAATLMMIIGGGYLIPYIAMPGQKNVSEQLNIPDHFAQFKTALGNGLLVGGFDDLTTMGSVALLICVALYLLLFARLKPFAILLCGGGGLLYLLTYKYIGQHRHHGLFTVECLFAYGLAGYYVKDRMTIAALEKYNPVRIGTIVLACALGWQSYMGFTQVSYEIDHEFSNSNSAAQYLIDNGLERKILVGHQSWAASSVLQHLPSDIRMYWPDTRRWGYFIPYDSLYLQNLYKYDGNYAAAVAMEQFPDSLKDVVLVMSLPITDPQLAKEWIPVYAGGQFVDDPPVKKQESYIIYRHVSSGAKSL